jgi:hypothetical protein
MEHKKGVTMNTLQDLERKLEKTDNAREIPAKKANAIKEMALIYAAHKRNYTTQAIAKAMGKSTAQIGQYIRTMDKAARLMEEYHAHVK